MTVNQNIIRLFAASTLLASTGAFAHGYITTPGTEARGYLCDKQPENSNCNELRGNSQSLEALKGFPASGPADSQIASAGTPYKVLDEQSPLRWVKKEIESGPMEIHWTFTANHRTAKFHYYMTKQNWNPSAALTRDSFELEPFCEVDYNDQVPPMALSHMCNIPERSGYQIMLAVWDVADTANAFYNVVDLTFDDETPEGWKHGGTIIPSSDLKAGDLVRTRVFANGSEVSGLATRLEITQDTQAYVWSYALATKINAEQSEIQSGQVNTQAEFVPVYGSNKIFVSKASDITSVEIQIEQLPPEHDVTITGVEGSYEIQDGSVTINFEASATGDTMLVNATLYDHGGAPLAYEHAVVEDNASHSFAITPVANVQAGHHILKLISSPKNGGDNVHENFDIMFKEPSTGEYDYSFPEGLGSYVEGTKVFQPKNGQIYQCKAFPYSGWCNIWSESASQYEPGVGSNSSDAWDEVN